MKPREVFRIRGQVKLSFQVCNVGMINYIRFTAVFSKLA